MKLRYAFKRTIANKSAGADKELKPEVPDGMLKKCNACKAAVFVDEVKKNAYICPHCGNYFRVHARRRIEMLADEGTFEEWDKVMPISNPLSYKGYEEKVKKLQEKTNLDEAIVTGKAKIGGISVVLGVCDSRFLMASMGENVGEKIARAVERATQERLPVVLFACSGGACEAYADGACQQDQPDTSYSVNIKWERNGNGKQTVLCHVSGFSHIKFDGAGRIGELVISFVFVENFILGFHNLVADFIA